MKTLLTFSFFFIITYGIAQDTSPEEIFKQANKLSLEEDIDGAISKYKTLEDLGLSSPELHFNMGTSYLKGNDISKAVLYLEKAHKADPGNNDIKYNLEIARSQIDSDIIEIPDFILLRFWRGISNIFQPIIWFMLQIIFGLLIIFGVYNWKLKDTSKFKMKGFVVSLLSTALLLFSISAGFTADKMLNTKDTAILMKSSDLKSGADDRSDSLMFLSEGVKLRINDQIGEWYKVQLINKEEGWIKVVDVSLI